MFEFDNIDETATIAKAKKVLNSFRRLDRIAGSQYSLSSSGNWQEAKTSHTPRKTAKHEEHLLRVITVEQERDRIRRTAESLEEPYRSILLLKFCEKFKSSNLVICQKLGYSESTFYHKQKQALLQFAECYKGGELLTFGAD